MLPDFTTCGSNLKENSRDGGNKYTVRPRGSEVSAPGRPSLIPGGGHDNYQPAD